MKDDRKHYLRQLEDTLLEDDPELLTEEEEPLPERLYEHRRIRADFSRTVYEDDPTEVNAVFDDGPRPKGAVGLVLLALLELAGIGAIIRWWIQWLG